MKKKKFFNLFFPFYFTVVPDDDGGGGGKEEEGGGGTSLLSGGSPTDKSTSGKWYDSLPDDIKNHQFVLTHQDLPTFVKSALETKSMVGANTIKKPGEKATPEERAAFYEALGRPKEPTGYEPSVKLSESVPLPDGVLDSMRGKFHELGLSADQGKGVMDAYFEILNGDAEGFAQKREQSHAEAMTKLQGEWGDATDNNIKTAQLAIREMGNDDLLQKLAAAGLDNDTDVIKFFHKVGVELLDDDATGMGESRFAKTEMAAQQEIANLTGDAEFQKVLGDRRAPGHKEAVERWLALHKQAAPGLQDEE